MSQFRTAIESALDTARSVAGETVTYVQSGGASIEITALPGSFRFRVDDGFGSFVSIRTQDFIVKASDLVGLGEPGRGDKIVYSGRSYEVGAPGGEPPFRFSDPAGTHYRIHCNEVSA